MKKKAKYGLDAPNVIRNLILSGILCLLISLTIYRFLNINFKIIYMLLTGWIFISAISLIITAILMIFSSKFGKIKERERILDILDIKGNEHILDVGCGKGLYLIGAAKRLSTGTAIGIDIWQNEDLSGNQKENTLQNANTENVINKISIETSDMRNMSFETNSFEIVLSSFAIHNIYDQLERKKALLEIIRVLKPGGKLCIIDFRHIGEYIHIFAENNISDIKKFKTKLIFPTSNVIIGVKK